MRRATHLLLTLLVLSCFAGSLSAEEESRYPVMHLDTEVFLQWQEELDEAPEAFIDPKIQNMLLEAKDSGQKTSMSLLPHLDYVPAQRDQGWCGNCWVWAATGVLEIAHDVQDSVFDRLSVQYLNSCHTDWACCGGAETVFVNWYNGEGHTLPWSNTNADFVDGARDCDDGGSLRTCASIGTTPDYDLASIVAESIDIHGISEADAIANIKNILHQDRGIYWSYGLPDDGAWDDFFDYWDGVNGETEASLWTDVNAYCGTEWAEGAGGAGRHAVLIVGYNDNDSDPDNHYWLVVNSWGTAGGVRPNGLFRIPMHMDYDCTYPDVNNNRTLWAFRASTIAVEFGNAPPTAEAGGPYEAACGGITTTIGLDGTGSNDPEGGPLDYLWTTDCFGGSFDDPTSATPSLTLGTAPGCDVECSVTLTVTDDEGDSDMNDATVAVTDEDAPTITCPPDVTVECDQPTTPSATGTATAVDVCDPSPDIDYTDVTTPGACPEEYTIDRTWAAEDECGNVSDCLQVVEVVDTTAPMIACNAPGIISPPDAPISFAATAVDNCDDEPFVEVTGYDCYKYTKKGKRISKLQSCVVNLSGPSITILDSGGVDDHIQWTVNTVDSCGNSFWTTCEVLVVNPAKDTP